MLVLSRRIGERLVIGDGIVITVIDVRSDGVRLGIEAPRDVRVDRAEVLDALSGADRKDALLVHRRAGEASTTGRPARAPRA